VGRALSLVVTQVNRTTPMLDALLDTAVGIRQAPMYSPEMPVSVSTSGSIPFYSVRGWDLPWVGSNVLLLLFQVFG